ncbi:hypothetical protein SO802_019845 [Lithocarpus litseifolius]|uniref:Uncharacterized protein n=1 Tax=Lithocarpus litseifolius TaxID=425828 RepID=A0AAW2CPV2_9ROSI
MKSFITISNAIFAVFIFCLVAWCCGHEDIDVAPMEKTEKEALYSAVQGFVGNWWNGSGLYPDPCGWTPIQGVSCDLFDGLWYVTTLNIGPIHDNSLGCAKNLEFRAQVFELKHLKTLSFFKCFVSPKRHPIAIPSNSWDKLGGSLESLEFRSNPGLIGKIPISFGVLVKLKSLVLIENGLTGNIPTNIGNLINLKRLVLAGNRFVGWIPDSFGGLNELLIYDLSRNTLSGPLPLTLAGLTSLLKLDLSNNQLEGMLPSEISNLKNLTLLDLRNNKISGGLTRSFQGMSSLEELVLSNNPIGGDLMSLEWHNLHNLVILDLSNIGLTGEIPESISKLKRLRFLGLSDNNLTGKLSPKLATLPYVSALYLNANNLTGELNFADDFYRKMGRRFGAWNNPNLCYPVGLVSASHVPYGVKPCQQQVTLLEPDLRTKLANGNMNQNSQFVASLGFTSYGISAGIWGVHPNPDPIQLTRPDRNLPTRDLPESSGGSVAGYKTQKSTPVGRMADKYSAIPNFGLVNESDLIKILKVEIFIHKDRQLRVAHLILGYNPLLCSFQAPKYVIKAKDRRLHLINVVVPSFLNLDPALEGVQQVEPLFQYTAEDEASPSQPTIKEEEEEEIVEVLDSEDGFEIFNQPQSPEVPAGDLNHIPPAQVSHVQEDPNIPDAMVLQCKTRPSLIDLLEAHVGGNVPKKAIQTKRPILPPTQDIQAVYMTEEMVNSSYREMKEEEGRHIAAVDAFNDGYDVGVAETEEALRAKVSGVCRTYCLQVWNEVLNQAGVEASSALRRAENVYYPPAIRSSGPPSSSDPKANTVSKEVDNDKDNLAKVLPSSNSHPKEAKQAKATEKGKDTTKGVVPEATKPSNVPKDLSKGKEAF